ncbi:hypothetical protein [Aureivirga sp. CE67]|uniref:hypothetical protein n=1 Tax=Aureivirga sp. CE67 TaxID=1788983 RepID=UPI0018CA00E7|nr:hypothetical protein [Aureivirga sp. CE67]
MKEKIEYGFWFWSHKLTGILTMLAELSKYDLDEIEIESIKYKLIGTNDEMNQWSNYRFEGESFTMDFQFAYDAEEKSDMIHILIKTDSILMEKLETLNLFQCMFKELENEY